MIITLIKVYCTWQYCSPEEGNMEMYTDTDKPIQKGLMFELFTAMSLS